MLDNEVHPKLEFLYLYTAFMNQKQDGSESNNTLKAKEILQVYYTQTLIF